MKKSILLLAVLVFLKPLFPVLEYAVNYDYISKVLCINKDKPKLKCNGKCHLMKELAKAAESEKPLSSDKKETTKQEVEVLFFQDIPKTGFSFFQLTTSLVVFDGYSNLYSRLQSLTIFHPPAVS